MAKERLHRWLSHVWPIRVATYQGRHGPLEVCWQYGRLVLNSSMANQSHGSLHRVWQFALTRVLHGAPEPGSVLMLGFGAGSAAVILRHGFGMQMPIVCVDDDPLVFEIARRHFGIDALGGLELVAADALEHLQGSTRRYDLVLVDLFHDLDPAPVMLSEALPGALLQAMAPGAVLCINTVLYDDRSREASQRMGAALRLLGAHVKELRAEGANRVLIVTLPDIPSDGPKFGRSGPAKS